MNDAVDFIAAICAEPAADTPRLVFADWLEERGEGKRAEFIRVQIALAGMGPPHKQTQWSEEPTALTPHGDKHYSFTGYVEDGFQVGDRIDLLVHRGIKKPKLVHGFRVYRIEPYVESYASRELDVYIRLDSESGPWKGAELRRRERKLFTWGNIEKWVTHKYVLRHTTSSEEFDRLHKDGISAALFSRGFISHMTCSSEDFLKHASQLVWMTDECPTCQRRDETKNANMRRYGGFLCTECGTNHPPGRIPRPCPEGAQPLTTCKLVTLDRDSSFFREMCMEDGVWTHEGYPGIVFELP